MAEPMERQIRVELSRSSHDRGTPTPSAPGEPPSMISEDLYLSITVRTVGDGHVQVGGTTAYARIQELGGITGRGHATTLPARPYLRPALESTRVEAREAALATIAAVIEHV
jgi:phage gpG-like protein